jgi:hypothetical protein
LPDLEVYRSKSSVFFQDKWKATKRLPRSCLDLFYAALNRTSQARSRVDDTEEGRRDVPTGSGPPPNSHVSGLPAGAREVFQNPPNIQLNISSDHFSTRKLKKGHEILITAIIGIILQTGLIAIAAVIAFHVSPKSKDSIMKSKVYGFPTYAGGSLLLSLGTGLCSLIIEHTTNEYSWNVRNVEKDNAAITEENSRKVRNIKKEFAPRLLWLQQKQSVNEQSFNGYVISSGPKHRVVTSSRRKISEKQRKGGKSKKSNAVSDEFLYIQWEYKKPQLTSSGPLGVVYSCDCSFSWHWIYSSVHGPSWSRISMLNCPTRFYLHHGSSSRRYSKAPRTSH